MATLKRVMLILRDGGSWDRGLIFGVSSYVHPWHPWSLRIAFPSAETLKEIPKWCPDGFVGRFPTVQHAKVFEQFGKPIVNITPLEGIGLPRVGADNTMIGQLAAVHLLDRFFSSFAFVGHSSMTYSQNREDGYVAALAKNGYKPALFHAPLATDNEPSLGFSPKNRQKLVIWLKTLPRPVALFACDDCFALEVLEACQKAGLSVPQDVAIMGSDNDETLCLASHPPLSSVELPANRVGFLAAKLLDRLLFSAKPPKRPITVKPTRVVARQSTDIVAVDDPELATALHYIREQVGNRINVSDVIHHQAISRRGLEQKFRKILGHSILHEIHQERLKRCKELLTETTLAIPEIAKLAGYRDARHLARAFAQKLGISPSRFRLNIQKNQLFDQ